MLQLEQNVNLQDFNTLAIPAQARYFASVTSLQALRELLDWTNTKDVPLLVLGGGSNLVLAQDFAGLVLQVNLTGIERVKETADAVYLQVGAGENWHKTVEYSLSEGCWGLENLGLIPGSVGAAPIQNIGAYGLELCERFSHLQAMDISTGELVEFDAEACQFGYRDSVFKRHLRGRYVITSVTLKLLKSPQLRLDYPALRAAVEADSSVSLTPVQVFDAVCKIRRSKLPAPEEVPNAGSFFKNPLVSAASFAELQGRFPDIVGYVVDPQTVKLAAGWLIERSGFKGYCEGRVGVHPHQALVLTNPGRGGGAEVLALAEKVAQAVKSLFGVELEMEPQVY